MRVELLFDAAQVARFDELLEGIERRVVDASPAFEAIADDFFVLERDRFASGASWQPDTPDWAARKAAQGRSTRTLVYTGTLEKSLTQPGAKYSRRRVERQRVTMGTRDPVANLHRRGARGGDLKPRPPVEVPDERIATWFEWLSAYLVHGELGGRGVGL